MWSVMLILSLPFKQQSYSIIRFVFLFVSQSVLLWGKCEIMADIKYRQLKFWVKISIDYHYLLEILFYSVIVLLSKVVFSSILHVIFRNKGYCKVGESLKNVNLSLFKLKTAFCKNVLNIILITLSSNYLLLYTQIFKGFALTK